MEMLDFTDALKDSPKFRHGLSKHENYFHLAEEKIKTIVHHFEQLVENGHGFTSSFQNALYALKDLNNSCLSDDSHVEMSLGSVTEVFSEFCKIHKVLIEQVYWSIIKNLNDFLKRDFIKLHDMRSHFQKVSQSLDDALIRNAQVSKHKDQEACEARNELTAVGTCFAHTALDYVFQLNSLKSRQKIEIVEAFGGFLNATGTYCHQASNLILESSPDDTIGPILAIDQPIKNLADPPQRVEKLKLDLGPIVTILKQQNRIADRKMQDRHMLVPKEIFQHPMGMSVDPDVVMEGYLFKRATNAFKTWNRRWFSIKDNKLLYCHRDIDNNQSAGHSKLSQLANPDGYTVMETDLRLCLVRPAQSSLDRRNCFELVTPNRMHVLQADSEPLCNAWIKALQRSIESALYDSHHEKTLLVEESQNDSSSSPTTQILYKNGTNSPALNSSRSENSPVWSNVSKLDEISGVQLKCKSVAKFLSSIQGNEVCADCGAFDPKWASINLGVTLCIECCAIHRSMGVQISKVRSLTLDAWEPEHVRLMELLGNNVVNSAYLAHVPQVPVPLPAKADSCRTIREAWIKAKYLDRKFVKRKAALLIEFVDRKNQNPLIYLNQISAKMRKTYCRAVSTPDWTKICIKKSSKSQSFSCPNFVQIYADEIVKKITADRRRISSSSSELLAIKHNAGAMISNEFEPTTENMLLHSSSKNADLKSMCRALALGACVNFSSLKFDNSTCLHQAVISGSLEACEYLLLNGAKINVQNSFGRTPLHLASQFGQTAQVCQLLKRGANQDVTTLDGKRALDLAMESPNADIVTLLRLARLNDEIKEADVLNPGDETFADVVRDFSHIATNRPEALIRDKK